MSVLIIVIKILLFIFTILVSIQIKKRLDIKLLYSKLVSKLNSASMRIEDYYTDKANSRIKEDISSAEFKMSLIDRIEIFVIDASNIRKYIPFFNIQLLFIVCAAVFIYTVRYLTVFLNSFFTSLIIGGCLAFVPIIILDIMAKLNSESIRTNIVDFISVFKSWIEMRNDLRFAFRKCVESDIREPLKTHIKILCTQIDNGLDEDKALDILAMKVNDKFFYNFIINIKNALKTGGDFYKLVNKLEDEAINIEEKFYQRKVSTFRDRILIYFLMMFTLFIVYYVLRMNDELRYLFTNPNEPIGQAILAISAVIFFLGFMLSVGITKFNH